MTAEILNQKTFRSGGSRTGVSRFCHLPERSYYVFQAGFPARLLSPLPVPRAVRMRHVVYIIRLYYIYGRAGRVLRGDKVNARTGYGAAHESHTADKASDGVRQAGPERRSGAEIYRVRQ